MAYVLSLRPHSPLKRSFSDNPYLASCSPLKDVTINPLHDVAPRNPSACSLYSLSSNRAGEWLRVTENTPPLTTCSLLDLTSAKDNISNQTGVNGHAPRKRTCGPNRPAPSFARIARPSDPYSVRARAVEHNFEPSSIDPAVPDPMVVDNSTDDDTEFFDLYEAIHVPLPEGRWSDNTICDEQGDRQIDAKEASTPQTFRRWMSTLRRRHLHRRRDPITDSPSVAVATTDDDAFLSPPSGPIAEATRSLSDSLSSSMGCVTAIKSASVTVASASIAPRSDASALADKSRTGKRSSYYSEARKSTESAGGALSTVIDESAWLRSAQRRKVVEELIATEEGYIADLKVLINASPRSYRHNLVC